MSELDVAAVSAVLNSSIGGVFFWYDVSFEAQRRDLCWSPMPITHSPMCATPADALCRDYRRPMYVLRYWLALAIARMRDVAHWLPQSEITYADDGSAMVTAVTNDLWRAHQILMRYREHCRVIEPALLVDMMRESAQHMVALYATDVESDWRMT